MHSAKLNTLLSNLEESRLKRKDRMEIENLSAMVNAKKPRRELAEDIDKASAEFSTIITAQADIEVAKKRQFEEVQMLADCLSELQNGLKSDCALGKHGEEDEFVGESLPNVFATPPTPATPATPATPTPPPSTTVPVQTTTTTTTSQVTPDVAQQQQLTQQQQQLLQLQQQQRAMMPPPPVPNKMCQSPDKRAAQQQQQQQQQRMPVNSIRRSFDTSFDTSPLRQQHPQNLPPLQPTVTHQQAVAHRTGTHQQTSQFYPLHH